MCGCTKGFDRSCCGGRWGPGSERDVDTEVGSSPAVGPSPELGPGPELDPGPALGPGPELGPSPELVPRALRATPPRDNPLSPPTGVIWL